MLARRARHIVTENQRVLDAVAALRAGDLPALGPTVRRRRTRRCATTTRSPRRRSTTLVAIGQADPAIRGARMTGGGFGGAVVMLARAGEGRGAAERIVRAYEPRVGRRAGILAPPPNGQRPREEEM